MPQRKRKSAQSPSIGFPITKLPPELQHLVFAASEIQDVRNLRLTCKALAGIGVSYVMCEAELLFTRSSFDRLKNVGPAHGRHFKSLIYRVNALCEHHDFDEYIKCLAVDMELDWEDMSADGAGPGPPAKASDREWRLYARQVARATIPKIHYTKRQLKLGWEAYKCLWNEQALLRNDSYGDKEVTGIISQLTNLKNVALTNCDSNIDKSKYFKDTFKETLRYPLGDEGYSEPSGVPQLLSVVRALNKAGITVESFSADMISWKILQADGANRKLMKKFLGTLKSIKSSFMIGQNYEWDHPDENLSYTEQHDECQEFLDRGGHLELLRSMSDLRDLDIYFFSSYDTHSLGMEPMFKGIYWCHLREVVLRNVEGSDRDLLDFLERHSTTLRSLKLSTYSLTKGLWLYIFREMRESLALTSLQFPGEVSHVYHSRDTWGPSRLHNEGQAQRQKIQAYVRGSDVVTLNDIINHGHSCSCQGGPYYDMHPSTAV
ncbi:MAG: hypothetical protein L6R38_009466 [Xanthoria sp. 2 TBL-2021]|nr:MAG: hypothetical protein L6R38_009466 [Xanthoria sp. 2 TBL-2021]